MDPMEIEHPDKSYRTTLLDELTRRKNKNPSYSLRAYARDLGISSTSLSDVLSAKRNLSRKNALKVAEKLGYTSVQTESLLSQIRKT